VETTATPGSSTPETRARAVALAGPLSATGPADAVTGLMGLYPAHHTLNGQVATGTAAAVPLWDPASGRFDPVRLRAAIVARGWTVGEFAPASHVSRACLYNALRGQAVGDRTVVRIVTTLDTRAPVPLIDG
jgi:hypothetical protein